MLNDALQLLLLFLIVLAMASQVNRAIYRLAWNARAIGPWSAPHPDALPRTWSDRLPVWGWLGLAREAPVHGRGYWIRPLLIELLLGIGLVALYLFERAGGLFPQLPSGVHAEEAVIRLQFAAHATLILLMTAATFIDLDERMIPDAITLPGTVAGLVFATIWPASLLPTGSGPLLLTAPFAWDERLDELAGLLAGLGIFTAWVAAVVPKTIWFRSGFWKAWRLMLASVVRYRGNYRYGLAWVVGMPIIAAVWFRGGDSWRGLLTSLFGLLVGGGIVWMVRLVAGRALLKEAMGFGDVTLMAMIGSFVGWQPALMIFFLAPFAGAIIAVIQYLAVREAEIAYGPFLCAATLVVLVRWGSIWDQWGLLFELGVWLPVILAVCLMLMGVMLTAWRLVRA